MLRILLGSQMKSQTINKLVFDLFQKIKNNVEFRTKLILLISFICNFGYAIFLFVVSQIYSSKWFFVMSIYYALLSIARIFIFFEINPKNQLRRKILIMRACGCFLLLLNLVVSVMFFLLIDRTATAKYNEIIVISLATYTFSALTLAIINIVKYLKKNDRIGIAHL